MSIFASLGWNLSLKERLVWMAEHGQSVTLTWGEDTGQWECSWITSGQRFTAVEGDPMTAVVRAAGKAERALTGDAGDAPMPRRAWLSPDEMERSMEEAEEHLRKDQEEAARQLPHWDSDLDRIRLTASGEATDHPPPTGDSGDAAGEMSTVEGTST